MRLTLLTHHPLQNKLSLGIISWTAMSKFSLLAGDHRPKCKYHSPYLMRSIRSWAVFRLQLLFSVSLNPNKSMNAVETLRLIQKKQSAQVHTSLVMDYRLKKNDPKTKLTMKWLTPGWSQHTADETNPHNHHIQHRNANHRMVFDRCNTTPESPIKDLNNYLTQ